MTTRDVDSDMFELLEAHAALEPKAIETGDVETARASPTIAGRLATQGCSIPITCSRCTR